MVSLWGWKTVPSLCCQRRLQQRNVDDVDLVNTGSNVGVRLEHGLNEGDEGRTQVIQALEHAKDAQAGGGGRVRRIAVDVSL